MDMKRDYYEDIRLLDSGPQVFWLIALIAALALFPFLAGSYHIYTVNLMAIHVIVALGLNLLVGYTGQISLGHAGFFAIGAYATLALMQNLGLPFLIALPLGGFISAGFGFLLGLPALRLEGPYLAIATLGFGLTITQILGRLDFLGGHMGLQSPALNIFGWTVDSDAGRYAVIMPICLFLAWGLRNLTKTRVGRAFVAIRDSDIAAECIGVNLTYYKTLAFAVSAFYTGIGGGLMAFVLGFISPHTFNIMVSIMFLAMVVVGGLGSVLGSVMGAVLITWLQLELARIGELPYLGPLLTELSKQVFTVSGLPNVQYVVFGLIMVLIIIFEPLGLYGFWIRTKIYWRTWPF
ncbi:MAG: branched-chain amino acid ABC transporter permease [Desulfarculaceae bacterium]|nr:branched-chain amino acid ABC transporter permease [Desulfarculaceae bacterium]MCF8073034.1 branched-chain amino acid ABC transporter permease [Desulfarculaceae bacterium]MCF8101881.1 branched-chain amino acid ABC transporter permease [Desulfarculaceae bacterium]MCF8115408.1 branched-chain amino acid ABC transporter permease [Desulfarculaceae bacterium]